MHHCAGCLSADAVRRTPLSSRSAKHPIPPTAADFRIICTADTDLRRERTIIATMPYPAPLDMYRFAAASTALFVLLFYFSHDPGKNEP